MNARLVFDQPTGSDAHRAKRARQKARAAAQPTILQLSHVETMILKAYRRPDFGIPSGESEHEWLDDQPVLVELNAPMERGKTYPNKPKFPTHRDATGKADLSYRDDEPEEAAPWGEWVRWQAEQEGVAE